MPFYVKRGTLPDKRHIQHRSNDGQLYYEELISREGFFCIFTAMSITCAYPPGSAQLVLLPQYLLIRPTKIYCGIGIGGLLN